MTTITDAHLHATLKSVFGFDAFRPLQHEAVRALVRGQDVLLVLPTGGGKSLCYQLPALVLDGITVVVSPLIALMKDQVDRLQTMGVAATFINSSLDATEMARRQQAVQQGQVRLLYVAPERLMMPGFLRLLATLRVALFAIDEAHCISEWGHDFRPEYRELRRLRALFPATPFAAFTATATRRVEADIITQLGLQQAANLRGSFNRPNLFYDVRPKQRAFDQLAHFLRQRGPVSGIIYCQSRNSTEDLAERLRADGFSAAAYHAGLESEERRLRQEAFQRDNLRIIVATIAFGMGIDKPDVRFVVHYDLPKNLEGYYQESGRAGRDGEPSDCLLFFSTGDVAKHEHFLREKPPAERRIGSVQLQQMAGWAGGAVCRRRALLAYFDEELSGQTGRCCDVCDDDRAVVDYTIPAQMLLSCVKRTGEQYGITHVVRVLRGSRDQRVLAAGHEQLTTYGIGRDRPREEWNALAAEMVRRGYLHVEPGQFGAVRVTELGNAVLFRGGQVLLPDLRLAVADAGEIDRSSADGLFEELRALRKRLADERGVPPFIIFLDATLRQMATARPKSLEDLRQIQGVGERKLLDFGDAFLEVIARNAPAGFQVARKTATRAGTLSDTAQTTVSYFMEGASPAEIAAVRKLALTTIEGHLAEALEAGERLDLTRLVTADRRRAIEAAFAGAEDGRLRPVMDTLGEGFTYGELRYVRAAMSWDDDGG